MVRTRAARYLDNGRRSQEEIEIGDIEYATTPTLTTRTNKRKTKAKKGQEEESPYVRWYLLKHSTPLMHARTYTHTHARNYIQARKSEQQQRIRKILNNS